MAFVPVESMIHRRQQSYYDALQESGQRGDSDVFIAYMLDVIHSAVEEIINQTTNIPSNYEGRIHAFRERMARNWFNRKDYLQIFKQISSATATRDLKRATEDGLLEKQGNGRTTTYRFR